MLHSEALICWFSEAKMIHPRILTKVFRAWARALSSVVPILIEHVQLFRPWGQNFPTNCGSRVHAKAGHHFALSHEEIRWHMMTYDELWWTMMNYDEIWWNSGKKVLYWIVWCDFGDYLTRPWPRNRLWIISTICNFWANRFLIVWSIFYFSSFLGFWYMLTYFEYI